MAWKWTNVTPAGSTPCGAALAYDPQRTRVVAFAGCAGDTWEWDGTTQPWSQRATTGPSARTHFAMAYDTQSSRAVLFGGSTNGTNGLADTWAWDGVAGAWTQLTPASSPPYRSDHSMVYDSQRGRVLLFGGWDFVRFTSRGDTWEWDGTNWTPRWTSPSPPARHWSAMAYDARRGRAVLFGGAQQNGPLLSDTWEWDGTTWTQRTPATSPPARDYPSMAWDAQRGRVILFGGWAGSYFSDTWEWDGDAGTWTQLSIAGPAARADAAMTYDDQTGRIVLFGGGNNSGAFFDTWVFGP